MAHCPLELHGAQLTKAAMVVRRVELRDDDLAQLAACPGDEHDAATRGDGLRHRAAAADRLVVRVGMDAHERRDVGGRMVDRHLGDASVTVRICSARPRHSNVTWLRNPVSTPWLLPQAMQPEANMTPAGAAPLSSRDRPPGRCLQQRRGERLPCERIAGVTGGIHADAGRTGPDRRADHRAVRASDHGPDHRSARDRRGLGADRVDRCGDRPDVPDRRSRGQDRDRRADGDLVCQLPCPAG